MATDNILASGDLLALISESMTEVTAADPTKYNDVAALAIDATIPATDATTPATTPAADATTEDDTYQYLNSFDTISDLNDALRAAMNDVIAAPHDQARVQALITFVKLQQQHNDEMYNLTVGMNNYFGK